MIFKIKSPNITVQELRRLIRWAEKGFLYGSLRKQNGSEPEPSVVVVDYKDDYSIERLWIEPDGIYIDIRWYDDESWRYQRFKDLYNNGMGCFELFCSNYSHNESYSINYIYSEKDVYIGLSRGADISFLQNIQWR